MANIQLINTPDYFKEKWAVAEGYIKTKQFSNALHVFEELAINGYSEAYVEIANLLENGNAEIKQDTDGAIAWYMKAIKDSGDPYAYIGIARLMINGYIRIDDSSDVIEYLKIAADTDNPMAFTILGSLYHSGKLVDRDFTKASDYYEKAIKHGYLLPMMYLAKLKWDKGYYLSALFLRLKTIWCAFRIARNDLHDPRLWNYL